jgi:hypothetical protein
VPGLPTRKILPSASDEATRYQPERTLSMDE